MEKYQELCELFREADSYFNGKDVDTNEINKNTKVKGYCSSDGCKTNEDGINAVAKYIIIKFKRSIKTEEYNDYDEYLLMWVSDKLYKIHKKGKGKKIEKGRMDAFTLKQAYGEYLEKHKKGLNYWGLLDMNQGLKEANLKYMSEFYKLLNIICKMITDYNNGAKNSKVLKYPANCSFQYKTLYMNISECKSYLDLLNKLKGVYDDFSSNIKKNRSNNKLATNLKKLTPEDGDELEAVRGFKSYDFNRPKCKFPIKKKTAPPKASKPNPGPALPQSEHAEPQQRLQGQQAQKQEGQTPSQNDPSLPTPQTGGSSNQNEPKDSGNSKENKGGASDNTGDPNGGNGNPGAGSNDPASNTSGGYFNWGSSFFKFLLNGTENLKKTSDFIDQNQKKVKDVTDKINNAYNDVKNNLKNVYDKSSDYLNNFISNITIQLNSIGAPSKPDGNPSEPEKSINGGDSPTPQTSQITQNSKEQTTTQQSPQGTSGNKNSDKTDQQEAQKPVANPVTKQENPGTELKGNGITEIGDGYVLKEYKKIGLSIIVILIPITLTIMYKYLSSGWRKELTRKKNMKKVINSIGGKRQVQIIISSSSHKKQTKKSINSVYKEKSPSLNIYKLMQADPVPFINLFFLLIFFVYKRKRDFIEL
ncbi:CIR protein PIR protein [Plasmodium vinckei vinckei]|uniref:CIR protein PIR protein n=1 Tax=Plasmodium vinckei vinckei TaxID=54757 RepID=A0A449BM74_PLAVN|nr:CIR protein PIR protein [Plasmodium vinckei vinckei]VEV54550.1 CIR protein PIR protein [Plasmodium vinckei vinckei]